MKTIAILTGGKSAELSVSLASASVVASNLDPNKYNVYLVKIVGSDWELSKDKKPLGLIDRSTFTGHDGQKAIRFDAVFMAIHGTPAEDGKLQGYFDVLEIPYTCCGVLASAITFDKDVCKQLLHNNGFKVAKSVLFTQTQQDYTANVKALRFPLFVKPNKNGSSYGVSKVKQLDDLNKAVSLSFEFDDEVLVEEFIDGRELGCGVFYNGTTLEALPITEIISENEFFDYEAKYQGKSKEITPAELTINETNTCHEVALEVYKVLKLRGAVRIDFFLSGQDFYVLEVNTIPGLSAESLLPQQAVAQGYRLSDFFATMIENAAFNQ